MHILKAELLASSRGELCAEPYRAVLVRGELGAILKVEQPIGGRWCPTGGSWYLSSLLGDGIPSDHIAIDFGQQWNIGSGMVAAIDEAVLFLAGQHTLEVEK